MLNVQVWAIKLVNVIPTSFHNKTKLLATYTDYWPKKMMNLNYAGEDKLIKKSLKQNKLQLKALGSSMFPFIRNGDLVEIKSVDVENLSIGDIIFFEKKINSFCFVYLK